MRISDVINVKNDALAFVVIHIILTIVVHVIVAGIADAVAVGIVLISVLHVGTVVADVTYVVGTLLIAVGLVAVGYQRTVIRQIEHTIVVGVFVTGVSHTVTVGVFLAAIGRLRTVVGSATKIFTVEPLVGIAVAVRVYAADQAVTGPANIAL